MFVDFNTVKDMIIEYIGAFSRKAAAFVIV
jgi:hypothetical protein